MTPAVSMKRWSVWMYKHSNYNINLAENKLLDYFVFCANIWLIALYVTKHSGIFCSYQTLTGIKNFIWKFTKNRYPVIHKISGVLSPLLTVHGAMATNRYMTLCNIFVLINESTWTTVLHHIKYYHTSCFNEILWGQGCVQDRSG